MHVPLPVPVPVPIPEPDPIPRNIWRFRNEGVEAFNKTLSKRFCVLCVVCCVLCVVYCVLCVVCCLVPNRDSNPSL
jgi:hypothetical protein